MPLARAPIGATRGESPPALLRCGRMTGTSPDTGTTYDLVAMEILPELTDPTTTISAGALDLDLWMWGRDGSVEVSGDPDGAERLRTTIIDATA